MFASMSREEVFSLAKKIHAVPFDKVKEPTVTCPVYEGLTPELSAYLSPNPPAGYVKPPRQVRPTKIASNALELVGNTPMIKLDRIRKVYDVEPTLYGKCEYFSAGGSVKDRIALRMIEDGEREGTLKPGDTLIEATSGNTGVGLCMAGAIKGYNVVITLPMKMSGEKVNMMKALGALILRTPNEAAWNDMSLTSYLQGALRRRSGLVHTCWISMRTRAMCLPTTTQQLRKFWSRLVVTSHTWL
jgi:hypothetical protein